MKLMQLDVATRPCREKWSEVCALGVPRTVALEILWGCNLRCTYCYIGIAKNIENAVIPPLDTTREILRHLADAKIEEVYLIGGEPLKHPHFLEICDMIASLGFPRRGVITNGTLVTRRVAEGLRNCGFYVDVSMRAAHRETFDGITQQHGSFDQVMRGLGRLADVGIEPVVEFDCTPGNHLQLYAMVDMLHAAGIPLRWVYLHRIAPYGDATLDSTLQLTLEQYQEVFRQASQIEEQLAVPVIFEDGFPLCLLDPKYWHHVVPCECGTTLVTIDPLGNLRRCACHPKCFGNVLQTPLRGLWNESLIHFKSLEWQLPECRSCALFDKCRGGCPVSGGLSQGYGPDAFANLVRPFAITES